MRTRNLALLLLSAALGGCSMAGGSGPENAADLIGGGSGKGDRATEAKWLWPGGDIYAIVDPTRPPWYEFWGSKVAGGKANDELVATAEELAANTPIRIHFAASQDLVEGNYFVKVLTEDEDLGPINAGIQGDLTMLSNAKAVRHEMGHIIGLQHTQQRSDRDQHVRVHIDQVKTGYASAFGILPGADIGPYDLASIMHYGSHDFTKDSSCAAITRLTVTDNCNMEETDRIAAQRERFSEWNYTVISALYCDQRFCGDNCAAAERCEVPAVQRNLERLHEWEAEQALPPGCGGEGQEECPDPECGGEGQEECPDPECGGEGQEECPDPDPECGGEGQEECPDPDPECGGEGQEECPDPAPECEGADCEVECAAGMCCDGLVDDGEACDTKGDSKTCNKDCTLAKCGDGIVNAAAGEECDDGKETRSCNANCTLAHCGDHIVNAAREEQCDDGQQAKTCNMDCTQPAPNELPAGGGGGLPGGGGGGGDGGDKSKTGEDTTPDTPAGAGCRTGGGSTPLAAMFVLFGVALLRPRRRASNV